MPIGFVVLLSGIGGGGSSAVRIGIRVVDEDQSFLSGEFVNALDREGFSIRLMSAAAYDSSASVLRAIRIAPGFQDSIMAGVQAPVYLNTSANAGPEASITARMHIYRSIGQILVNIVKATQTEVEVTNFNDPTWQEKFQQVAAKPPLVSVVSDTLGTGRAVPSGMKQSLPATMTLFMLINTAIYGAVYLTQEKQDRILARMATYPISGVQILLGKLLGRTLMALVQALILLLTSKFLLKAFLGNDLLALALVVVSLALTVGAIALFWGSVLRRVDQASSVALISSLFMGAIGGCWWPLEIVPEWMRVAGHISPAAWAMDAFHSLISFGAGLPAVIVPCLVLLGYSVVFTLIGARLLKYSD